MGSGGREESAGAFVTFDGISSDSTTIGTFNSISVEEIGLNVSGDYFAGIFVGDFQGATLNLNIVFRTVSVTLMLGVKSDGQQFGLDIFNGDFGFSVGGGPGRAGLSITGTNTVVH